VSRGERLPAHTLLLGRWLLRALRGGATAFPRGRPRVGYGPLHPDPRRIARFLEVTGGEDLPFLGQGLVPPTYVAVWETAAALELLRRAGAPSPHRGLIHLESERLLLRPLRLDAAPRLTSEIEKVEPHPRGRRVTILTRVLGRGTRASCESRFVLLLRGPAGRSGAARPAAEEGVEEWDTLQRWSLPAGSGRRYARVAGDYNPVHLWGWSARLLGYPRPILHGFCLEALVTHALLRGRHGGDPRGLARLAIRFRAPVLLPSVLRLEAAARGAGRFRVLEEEDGRVVASGGWTGGGRASSAAPVPQG
jgi:acyl dehydratase